MRVKPCPWCGDRLTEVNVIEGSTFRWRKVSGCCTDGPEVRHDTLADDQKAAEADSTRRAIQAWNQRGDKIKLLQWKAHPAVTNMFVTVTPFGLGFFIVQNGEKEWRVGQSSSNSSWMQNGRPTNDDGWMRVCKSKEEAMRLCQQQFNRMVRRVLAC